MKDNFQLMHVCVCDSVSAYASYPNMIGFPVGSIFTLDFNTTVSLKKFGLIIIFLLQKHVQKYNDLQPPDIAVFYCGRNY